MNKKGNLFLGFWLGLFIFVSGVLILPFLMDDIDTTRIDLNCYSEDISVGNKLTCLNFSFIVPLFIWFICSACIGLWIGGLK